tara:strand:+ start:2927 stop:4069 length:1143 start_codon:yes stop_codon:yes gene_type:complete
MSLNFPTAFWKTDTPPEAEDLDITWTTSLAQSYGDNETTPPSEFSFPTGNSYDLTNHNFPFAVTETDGGVSDFYYYYDEINWQGDSYATSTPYFGWYRNGGTDTEGNTYNLSPSYHKSNPWIIDGFGRPNEIHIFFESDLITSLWNGWGEGGEPDPYGRFNSFIQSGEATGTFDISSAQVGKNLVIKVSGLGEDEAYVWGAQNYDVMTLYLDRPSISSDDFICSGCAPMDGRNTLEIPSQDANYDMQQVKLYTGSNIYSPANADPANETAQDTSITPNGWSQFGDGGDADEHENGSERTVRGASTWGEYLVSGAPRANPTQKVNQLTRSDHGAYITSAGVGTFTASNLQLGTHKIKISTSTVDGTWSSGAFYGFYFTLVD